MEINKENIDDILSMILENVHETLGEIQFAHQFVYLEFMRISSSLFRNTPLGMTEPEKKVLQQVYREAISRHLGQPAENPYADDRKKNLFEAMITSVMEGINKVSQVFMYRQTDLQKMFADFNNFVEDWDIEQLDRYCAPALIAEVLAAAERNAKTAVPDL